ncbi:N-acyl-D-amino-acid deacylase family protein [Arthrobacter sp. CG_A4]|uniref:N-acyl-D-amino-acid deacylase family protein n=1 Tax=Arthrobacter sp. CG_A4 TaxID=3071706 RepID=UPI002E0C42C0|nr:N-acyl-D-amino-acid deacylase [Arthrobacter sp. CG_A4]
MTNGFDLVINNARIIDGTGGAAAHGSVAVRDGRIVAVAGTHLAGATTIDARGQVLAPGFIDLHSHADFSLGANPEATTQISQGVTTLLTGNCGTSPFPVKEVEALKSATSFLRPALEWDWQDAAGFADKLRASRPAINAALQVGHSALRLAVVGDEQRAPTASELDHMRDLLRQAADQGARGYSTGLIYAPCSFAKTDEIIAMAQTAADCGLLYSTHMRNETDQLLEAVDEALDVARATGVRLEISHIKAMGPRNHGKVSKALDRMAAARDEGLDVTADVYPYTASSTTLTSRLPDWSLDGGGAALLARLGDAAERRRISDALALRFEGEIDPAGIVLAGMPEGKYTPWIGYPLTEVAQALEMSPHEAALDVVAEHRASVAIVNHAMIDDDVQTALQDPFVSVASDGWVMTATGTGSPHPRSFGTFTRVLGHYVRKLGTLSLEEAVRKMTSLPASRAGLVDRGTVLPGFVADLVMFDPETVIDRSTYIDPWQLSAGISHVLVAGETAYREGVSTGVRVGQIL